MKARVHRYVCSIITFLFCLLLAGCSTIDASNQMPTFAAFSYYDSEKGEIQSGTALEEKIAAEQVEHVQEGSSIMEDGDALWDVKGVPAFYIPDYHSARTDDVIEFLILDVQNDDRTVVYAYETLYYGTESDWDALPLSGIVPETNVHRDWADDVEEKPAAKEKVCCMIAYQIETREYKILYRSKAYINDQVDSIATNDGEIQNHDVYVKELFAQKVRDTRGLFGDDYYYLLLFGTEYCILDLRGDLRKSADLKTDIENGFSGLLKTKEDRSKNWEIRVENAVGDGAGNIYLELVAYDLNAEDLDEDASEEEAMKEKKSFIMNFQFMEISNSIFVSENVNCQKQVEYWKETESTVEDTKDLFPDGFNAFHQKLSETDTAYLGYSRISRSGYLNSSAAQSALGKFWSRCAGVESPAEREAIWALVEKEVELEIAKLENKAASGGNYWAEIAEAKEELAFIQSTDVPELLYGTPDYESEILRSFRWRRSRSLFYLVGTYSKGDEKTNNVYQMQLPPGDIRIVPKLTTATRTSTYEDEAGVPYEEIETAEFIAGYELTFTDAKLGLDFYYCDETDSDICANHGVGYCKYTQSTDAGKNGKTDISFYNGKDGMAEVTLPMEVVNMAILPDSDDRFVFNAVAVGIDSLLVGSAETDVKKTRWTEIPFYKILTDLSGTADLTDVYLRGQDEGESYNVSYNKKIILNNNAICQDGSLYRFSSLDSGILLYDPRFGISNIMNKGAYYSSWKLKTDDYLAIGFQGELPVTPQEGDIMKAKAYYLDRDERQEEVDTLNHLLADDKALQEIYLQAPEKIYEAFGLERTETLALYEEAVLKKESEYRLAYETFLNLLIVSTKAGEEFIMEKQEKFETERIFRECYLTESLQQLLREFYCAIVPPVINEDEIGVGEDEEYRDTLIFQAYQEAVTASLDVIKKENGYTAGSADGESKNWDQDMEWMLRAIEGKNNMWTTDYSYLWRKKNAE